MIMQNSPNQQDVDQDQRKNGSMKDSTVMTIEFLRARLLSERSVSRTARQRADELAKRVVELEEQLKSVSLQRKKAEKAIADVLTVLENHGISEFSDEFDSNSDQDVIHFESKMGDNSPEDDESSVGSKMRGNHTDEFSGSELESSPLPGRSLSLKSGKNSLRSREKKYMDSPTRRRSTSASTTSASPRHHIGKSCRQIRRRETRSAVESSQINNSMLALQHNGVATCSEGRPTCSDMGPELSESPEKPDAKIFLRGPILGDLENQSVVAKASNYLNIHGSDNNMERALDHQAQLIGQFEEEEKAQREWEEKFRENNNATLDSCEPGNQSDITEERDETKAHAPYHAGTTGSEHQETELKVDDVSATKELSNSQSGGFQSPLRIDIGCSQDQKKNMLAHESPTSEFVFPVASGSRNYSVPPSNSYHHPSCSESPTGNLSAQIFPSHTGSDFSNGDISGSNNENYALIPCDTPDKLGSVLEALHRAKLSLKQKANPLPPSDGGSVSVRKAIEFSVGDKPEVPVGSAGLFRVPSDLLYRVPSDFPLEATSKTNLPDSNSRLSLTNYYPNSLYSESSAIVSTGNRQPAIPSRVSMESRSKIPTWEPQETGSRVLSCNSFFGPSLGTGLPSSSRYAYFHPDMAAGLLSSSTGLRSGRFTYSDPKMDTSHVSSSIGLPSSGRFAYNDPKIKTGLASPAFLLHPDLIPQMPSNEVPQFVSTSGAIMPPANRFSSYEHHIRPSMYK
ncbi:uncharacterized protein LOC130764373 isoform X2 [Actinidia eriantha]|uniref:uncharacterized protein LOC130764373 isoform X2 n=1 Tax=Actinidia eriantha TaxID=165200 RepID=UPI00258CFC2C|nr:uncharacterized protein LOC130764373 isoform X2 [Actinidia eriantha]